ncbi:MAG: Ig-like domain-containing protein, partial [Fibrobacter sp.]|nr:Ig-like domain-containing protein [Fibrobacter sp.]
WEKRNVANLPTEIPAVAGVGGRFGKMPEYNQGFGVSKKATEVKLNAPAAGAKFDAGAGVTLTAAKSGGDGSIKSVDFYIGNDLVGTAMSEPYSVTASGLSAGVYSAVAVATDNNGLVQMSPFVTFEVEGSVEEPASSSSVEASVSSADPIASSSGTESIFRGALAHHATEAETGLYRIFDMQGRPLFVGERKPAKMPAARVIVIECTKSGAMLRRYIQ